MPMFKAGIIDYTWANKPSVAPSGQIICVTDVAKMVHCGVAMALNG